MPRKPRRRPKNKYVKIERLTYNPLMWLFVLIMTSLFIMVLSIPIINLLMIYAYKLGQKGMVHEFIPDTFKLLKVEEYKQIIDCNCVCHQIGGIKK